MSDNCHWYLSKSEVQCQRKSVVSSVFQEFPPVAGNVLILSFDFHLSPRRMCCSGSQGFSNSFVQLMKSVLMKAVPRSCTKEWGFPKECIHFWTAEVVVWAPRFVTGYIIKKRENVSITKRQWRFRLLGVWRGPLWSKWIVRNGTVSFFHSSNGTSFLCLGLNYVVLATQTINSECTYLNKHARRLVETFGIIVDFWSAHVSTLFVVVVRSKTS